MRASWTTQRVASSHRNGIFAAVAAGLLGGAAGRASGVAIPIQDPGFNVFLTGTLTPVPDNRSIDGGQGGQVNQPLRDAAAGTFTTGQAGDTPAGWVTFGGTNNRFRHDIEFPSPSGAMGGAVSAGPTVFAQTFAATPVLPNTVYTATFQIIDRDSSPITGGAGDVTGIAAVINLALLADFGGAGQTDLGGVKTFVRPANGGRSTFTLALTTGATVPSGNLSIAVSADGASPDASNTQTFFDNATLDATPVPEPATAGFLAVGALALGRRRRGARVL